MPVRVLNLLLLAVALTLPVAAKAERSSESAPKSEIELDKLKRSSLKQTGKNLFAARSWGAAVHRAPKQQASVSVAQPTPAPVAPVAPPVPFSYMGKMVDEESGKLVLYLAKGDVSYLVTLGEVIEGMYRVEAVTEKELTLIYLPLNTKQTLIIGESNS